MKINGLIDEPRWKGIACCCIKGDVLHSYPIGDCIHCKFQECEDSMPRKDFTVNDDVIDKNGKVTKKQTKVIKEITLVRGKKYQDIMGWTF